VTRNGSVAGAPVAVLSTARGALLDYGERWWLAVPLLGILPWAWATIPRWTQLDTRVGIIRWDLIDLLWSAPSTSTMLAIALALTQRERPLRTSTLLRRVPRAISVCIVLLIPFIPAMMLGDMAADSVPPDGYAPTLCVLAVALVGVFLWMRCIAWIPLVLEADFGVLRAGRVAWLASVGRTWWLLGMATVLAVPVGAALVITVVSSTIGQIAWILLGPFIMFVWVRVYTQVMNNAR
jgi:hypothetical protein